MLPNPPLRSELRSRRGRETHLAGLLSLGGCGIPIQCLRRRHCCPSWACFEQKFTWFVCNWGRASAVSGTRSSSCPTRSSTGCPSRRISLCLAGRCLSLCCQIRQKSLCAAMDNLMSSIDVFSLGLPHCAEKEVRKAFTWTCTARSSLQRRREG